MSYFWPILILTLTAIVATRSSTWYNNHALAKLIFNNAYLLENSQQIKKSPLGATLLKSNTDWTPQSTQKSGTNVFNKGKTLIEPGTTDTEALFELNDNDDKRIMWSMLERKKMNDTSQNSKEIIDIPQHEGNQDGEIKIISSLDEFVNDDTSRTTTVSYTDLTQTTGSEVNTQTDSLPGSEMNATTQANNSLNSSKDSRRTSSDIDALVYGHVPGEDDDEEEENDKDDFKVESKTEANEKEDESTESPPPTKADDIDEILHYFMFSRDRLLSNMQRLLSRISPFNYYGIKVSKGEISDEKATEASKSNTEDIPSKLYPSLRPLPYYPWITIREIMYKIEKTADEQKQIKPETDMEYCEDVVELNGKQFLLKSKRTKADPSGGGTRPYVALISLTPLTDEEAKIRKAVSADKDNVKTDDSTNVLKESKKDSD